MKIGIIGSQLADLTTTQQHTATIIIRSLLFCYALNSHPLLVSGGCDGIDTFAEAEAEHLGIVTKIFRPLKRKWEGPGGFKERNIKIVEESDVIVAIRSLTSSTYGSGWTADYADSVGKEVHRIYV